MARVSGKLSGGKKLKPNSLGRVQAENEGLERKAEFVSLSQDRQQITSTATNAVMGLTENPEGSDLQITWFGTFSRDDAVLATFTVHRVFLVTGVGL